MQAAEIDPQAKAALDGRRFSLPHSRLGLKLLRPVARLAGKYGTRNPPAVGDVTDLTIPGPAGDLRVRRYRPRNAGEVPTVVFFHGGGFVIGGLETHDVLCRRLTRESGCAVLSVAYRLAPEHPFPAAVEDAYAATVWAAANPDRLGGVDELAVAGDSAGANLAAVVALMAAERDGPELAHQALLYPATSVEESQESVQQNAGIVLDEADLRFFDECYYGSEIHRRNPYADPARADDLSEVAPATVITAGFDPLRDAGKGYAEQLLADGVDVRYENYPAQVHGFATMEIDAAERVAEDLGRDLRSALRA
ncbi:alpha/beta hydrolase [Halolamina sp. CBA1230]|uniref:alpha/beta hydrolase n=1 Tax=Halolamina sp. CBA1230 TaxID=1853690 RepID=UPI0009A1BFF0|nr:alpha/beta hydrolase [Halolamina sp. CBA1230]QKY19504.1 alpha/beta hydrolase [Halolamina sp. CBA1230]